MSYHVCSLQCRNRSHGYMEYTGEGNYVCSTCGATYHDRDFDDSYPDESLSVYDAAQSWASRGKDSDYMFSYSESELESAL